eukprot:scaffold901_cov167-Amphora_coffeaeformis.AAC.25
MVSLVSRKDDKSGHPNMAMTSISIETDQTAPLVTPINQIRVMPADFSFFASVTVVHGNGVAGHKVSKVMERSILTFPFALRRSEIKFWSPRA